MHNPSHKDLFNFFPTCGNWQQASPHRPVSLSPNLSIFHLQNVEVFEKCLIFHCYFALCSVCLRGVDFSLCFRLCARLFSDQKTLYFSKTSVQRTELHWESGAPMNHLQAPTGGSSYQCVIWQPNAKNSTVQTEGSGIFFIPSFLISQTFYELERTFSAIVF